MDVSRETAPTRARIRSAKGIELSPRNFDAQTQAAGRPQRERIARRVAAGATGQTQDHLRSDMTAGTCDRTALMLGEAVVGPTPLARPTVVRMEFCIGVDAHSNPIGEAHGK